MEKLGTLYVVATPIGNLEDISQRALSVLARVDKIVAEDTRHSGQLLKHFSIKKPMLALHDFNENNRLANVIAYLLQGESLALISDAGTPLISDPGFLLVQEAKRLAIPVVPIPGPSACITALSASGLPADRFIFEGFLPVKKEALMTHLQSLCEERRTLIFYEAPHRLLKTLKAMVEVFGADREATIARELTKIHESIKQASLLSLYQHYLDNPTTVKGEIVIIVKGCKTAVSSHPLLPVEQVLSLLLKELPLKQAVQLTAELTGERKNTVYAMALQQK